MGEVGFLSGYRGGDFRGFAALQEDIPADAAEEEERGGDLAGLGDGGGAQGVAEKHQRAVRGDGQRGDRHIVELESGAAQAHAIKVADTISRNQVDVSIFYTYIVWCLAVVITEIVGRAANGCSRSDSTIQKCCESGGVHGSDLYATTKEFDNISRVAGAPPEAEVFGG